jgi:hypothetical protein
MTISTCAVDVLIRDAVAVVAVPPHVTVEQDLSPDLPLIEVDANQLRRVFVNLVQNGCEAIPTSRRGRVQVSATATGGEVVIAIADEGGGIPPEVRARIFDALFTTKARGTGLGLAVAARVVERHGGALALESSTAAGGSWSSTTSRRSCSPSAPTSSSRASTWSRPTARRAPSSWSPPGASTWCSPTCGCPGWTASRCSASCGAATPRSRSS